MIFQHIDTLKKQFTDKYVVVDASRPELQRFRGMTGAVKTVNMSGRALVQFDGYNNIGWYDIDPSYLKIVDAPPPKPVESKKDKAAAPKAETPKSPPAAAKPIGEAKPAAAPTGGKSVADILAAARKPAGAAAATPAAPAAEAKPAAAPAAKAAPGGKGMSMDDILAAARGKKAAGAAPASTPTAKTATPAPAKPVPAAEKPAAAPSSPAKVAPGGKGMSMDDILAAARGKKTAGAAPLAPATAAKPAPAPAPVQEPEPASEEPDAEVAAPATSPAAPPAAEPAVAGRSKKDVITTVAEQVAYCRKVDSK